MRDTGCNRLLSCMLLFFIGFIGLQWDARSAEPLQVYLEFNRSGIDNRKVLHRLDKHYSTFSEFLRNDPGWNVITAERWKSLVDSSSQNGGLANTLRDAGFLAYLRIAYDKNNADKLKFRGKIEILNDFQYHEYRSITFDLSENTAFGSVENLQLIVSQARFMVLQNRLIPEYAERTGLSGFSIKDLSACAGNLAWNQNPSGYGWSACLKRGDDEKPAEILSQAGARHEIAIGDKYLVMVAEKTKLVAYDLETMKPIVVSDSKNRKQNVTTHGNRIIWSEWTNRDKYRALHYVDKPGDSVRILCDERYDQVNACLDGHIVVWQDKRNSNWDIYLHDFNTCVTKAIADSKLTEVHPVISGNRVVFLKTQNRKRVVHVYDLATGQSRKISNDQINCDEAFINNNYVVYRQLDTNNIRMTRAKTRAYTHNICLYNLNTNKTWIIAGDNLENRNPVVNDQKIYWLTYFVPEINPDSDLQEFRTRPAWWEVRYLSLDAIPDCYFFGEDSNS